MGVEESSGHARVRAYLCRQSKVSDYDGSFRRRRLQTRSTQAKFSERKKAAGFSPGTFGSSPNRPASFYRTGETDFDPERLILRESRDVSVKKPRDLATDPLTPSRTPL